MTKRIVSLFFFFIFVIYHVGGFIIKKSFILFLILIFFLSATVIYAEDNSTSADNNVVADEGSNLEEVNIEVNDLSLYYKNGKRLNVGLYDSNNESIADQVLIININNMNYTKTTNSEGRTSIAINLSPGTYLTNIYFSGNDKYSAANASANVNVLPIIEGSDLVKYYHNSTAYSATFIDGSGDPLENTNVEFNINGIFYTRTTDNNGKANLNINLLPGDYTITAYNPINNYPYSNNIKVLHTISAADLHKIYRDNNQYLVTFYGPTGELLNNNDVIFNINGIFYTRKTNVDGIAKLNINLPQGEYIITSYNLNSSEPYSNKIIVEGYSATTLTSECLSIKANEDDTLVANLTNKLNYGVYNEKVTLLVNDMSFSTFTDENGVASFNPKLPQGNYTLSFDYPGSNIYGPSSTSASVELFDGIKTSIKSENATVLNGNYYSAVLFDENNTPMSNETVYFDLNNVIYNATTNDKGVASIKINLKSGYYNIVSFFNKTDYKFSKSISKILVISNNKTEITPLTTEVIEGLKNLLYIKLSADNVNLAYKKVIFEINGKKYTRTTNDAGLANITVNLPAGMYNVNYYFSGDDNLEASSSSSSLDVKARISTYLVSGSASSFHKNSGIPYSVLLASSAPLANKEVTFTVGSKTVTTQTNDDGFAYLDINDLNPGSYVLTCEYKGDNELAPATLSQPLEITFEIPYGYSYWVRYDDMYDLNLASLASQGTHHIFLHSYAFTAYGESAVLSWIRTANSYGVQVHIWMQVFYSGSWVVPVNDGDGSIKYSFINSKINEATRYASLSGVAGVHFDYLRCPGTAYKHSNSDAAINYFVSEVSSRVKSINPNCILSAAVMPEPDMMMYYYAQDIPTISRYLDVIIPMVYKGNYHKNTDWIQQVTQQFVAMSNGAQIWTGLQTYRSDSDITKLSYSELSTDAQAALYGGARGVTMFRWGVTNFINFNDLRK